MWLRSLTTGRISYARRVATSASTARRNSSFGSAVIYGKEGTKVRDAAAQALKKDMAQDESLKSPAAIWQWWKSQKTRLKNFFEIARILVLIVPSSAVVERFFSIVKAQTTPQQNAEYADTFGGRAMALFN